MPQPNPAAAALQMCSGDDVSANLAQARSLLEDAARAKCMLAVLPENFGFMGARESDKLAHAETEGDGVMQHFLSAQARRLGLWIVGGTVPLAVDGDAKRVYAACLVYGPDGRCHGRYDKMHLFDVEVPREDGVDRYHESATIAPGAERFVVLESPAGRIGLSVCYDLRFPELYRHLARHTAEIIVVPSAFTQRTGEAHWEPLLRARAIENQCYVIAPNQQGQHPGSRRTFGHSMIVDPWGQIVAQRVDDGAGVVTAPLVRDRVFQLRRSFPVLTHRRVDL